MSSFSSNTSYRSLKKSENKNEIGWPQVCIALIRSMVGTSAFTVSSTFSKSGWLCAGIALIIFGVYSCFSLLILFVCADKKKNYSYQSLVAKKLGEKCFFILNMMVLGAEFFSLLKGIDSAVTLFGLIIDWPQWALTLCIGVLVLILTFAKNNSLIPKTGESMLNLFNYINFFILIYFVATVIYQTCERPTSELIMFDSAGIFGTFSKALVSYSAQTNLLDVLSKVKSDERKKVPWAIGLATLFTCIFYLSVGVLGYLTFGQSFPSSNLLVAYGPNYYTGTFICIITSMLLVLVYLHFKLKPLKDVLEWIFTQKSDSVKGFWRFFFYLLAIVIACLIVIFWASVNPYAELIKAILEPGIIFLFPIALYLKMTCKRFLKFWNGLIIVAYLAWSALNIFCFIKSDLGFCSS